ncbi:MAG: GNAT family protein [Spirochaetota bacterium]
MQPICFSRGEKVYLSPAMISDADIFMRGMNDPSARLFARSRRDAMNDLTTKEMLERLMKHDECFVVRRSSDDAGIGYVLILDRDQLNREAMLAITICDEKDRGKGYGEEAMRLLLDHAFVNLNLESVYLGVYSYNLRAKKLYEKLGFRLVGLRRHSRIVGDAVYDEYVMDMIASEYFGRYGNSGRKEIDSHTFV